MIKQFAALAATAATGVALSGCGTGFDTNAAAVDSSGHQIVSCGQHFTVNPDPQRVLLMQNVPVLTLDKLGVLDRVVAKAGAFPEGYYPDDLAERVDSIDTLADKMNASGHLELSAEEAVAAQAEVIVGRTSAINAQTVPAAAVVDEPAFCGELDHQPTFDDVYQHVRFYGDLFNREQQAEDYIGQLRSRVGALPGQQANPPRVVVLYPAGNIIYAYGEQSMATTVVESAGGENVFRFAPQRVFEVSVETLVEAQPDAIVVVSSTQEATEAGVEQVKRLPGMAATPAGQSGQVVPLLLNHVDPAGPLVVDGAEMLAEQFSTGRNQ